MKAGDGQRQPGKGPADAGQSALSGMPPLFLEQRAEKYLRKPNCCKKFSPIGETDWQEKTSFQTPVINRQDQLPEVVDKEFGRPCQ